MPLGNKSSTTPASQDTPVEEVSEQTVVTEEVKEDNLPDVTLIVEDGSGLSDANSYCDLDYALEYCTMKGYSNWHTLSENEQKIFIIRGTDFVDNFFNWKGRRCKSSQSMAFPRVELYDDDRYEVQGIPDKLKKACIEAAFLNSSSDNDSLFTTKDENGAVKRQKVDTLEVEYFNNQQTSENATNSVDYTSLYDVLNKLLKGLYKTGNESSSVCTQARYGW